jgi:hypothetical protein
MFRRFPIDVFYTRSTNALHSQLSLPKKAVLQMPSSVKRFPVETMHGEIEVSKASVRPGSRNPNKLANLRPGQGAETRKQHKRSVADKIRRYLESGTTAARGDDGLMRARVTGLYLPERAGLFRFAMPDCLQDLIRASRP